MTRTTHDRLPITAAVLAGGRSMRMGVDKTLLAVDGEPLRRARRATRSARSATTPSSSPTVPRRSRTPGCPTTCRSLADEVAYQGPLGGLVTAHGRADDDWVLAVAADMP